jgi:uncharacterized protein YaiL (DUF2058 family)
MSQSVRDQLLKLGVVNESKVADAKREQRAGAKQAKKARKSRVKGDATAATAEDTARSRAQAALKARAERDKEAARKKRLNEERSALKAQIAQIIDRRREPRVALRRP